MGKWVFQIISRSQFVSNIIDSLLFVIYAGTLTYTSSSDCTVITHYSNNLLHGHANFYIIYFAYMGLANFYVKNISCYLKDILTIYSDKWLSGICNGSILFSK